MHPNSSDIGGAVKAVAAVFPVSAAAGVTNGASLDRQGFGSAVLQVACGAAAGSPSAQTVDAKLQHSPDGTTWSDLPGAAAGQLATDNAAAERDVDLSPAERYLRAVVTVGFTGGTSPAIPVAATVLLGGAAEQPA